MHGTVGTVKMRACPGTDEGRTKLTCTSGENHSRFMLPLLFIACYWFRAALNSKTNLVDR
jgi:hypothetical protein